MACVIIEKALRANKERGRAGHDDVIDHAHTDARSDGFNRSHNNASVREGPRQDENRTRATLITAAWRRYACMLCEVRRGNTHWSACACR